MTLPASLGANPILGRWLSFDEPHIVTVRTGKVELGQGATTALAAIAAAELSVRLDQIAMEAVETVHSPDEGYTAGSYSIEQGGEAIRWACALARTLFAEEAKTALGLTVEEVVVEAGSFSRLGGNVSVDYWQLRSNVDLDRSAADLPPPRLRGGSADHAGLRRLDLPAKLSGAGFIQDMRLPGMLYGRVLRPAHPKDKLRSFDRAAVSALPGVAAVVVDGSFAGVVAERDEQALRGVAVAARSAKWEREAELPPLGDANAWMATLEPKSTTFLADPEPAAAAVQRHAARYSRPYLAHASIGPCCAIAQWSGERLTVWSHSQGIYPLQRQLARALRIKVDQVTVLHGFGSGCYGHNGADDVALDAALLARGTAAPVMCMWTRADELSWSPFGAAMAMEVSAGLDATGQIVDWTYAVWSSPHLARPGFGDGVNLLAAWDLDPPHAPPPPNDAGRPAGGGDRNSLPMYRLGKRTLTHHLLPQGPLHSSALRSLGAHGNIFAIESFMDELAALAEIDPVRFRLNHLEDERAIAVLVAAADLAKWDAADPGGEGLGRGIGLGQYKNHAAYCAVVAKVEVAEKVRLISLSAAVDTGAVVHRNGLLNQVEGGLIQAASWTLKEAVHWTEEGFANRSWADYPILSFSEAPTIETIIIDRPDYPSVGAGECGAGPVAAAIGNAIAHALGVRVRDMPLTPDRIVAAINSL